MLYEHNQLNQVRLSKTSTSNKYYRYININPPIASFVKLEVSEDFAFVAKYFNTVVKS